MNKGYPHSGRLAILVAIGALAFAACSAPSSPARCQPGEEHREPHDRWWRWEVRDPAGLGRRNQASGPVGCLHA